MAVAEKEVEEVDSVKIVTENGPADTAVGENGDTEKDADVADGDDAKDNGSPSTDEEQNGDKKEADVDDINGDSTDASAEAVKRKVAGDVDESSEDAAATPEKKAN